MKKIITLIAIIILVCSCNTTPDPKTYADNKGPNDGRITEINKVKDTINVFDIISIANEEEITRISKLDGAPREEVTTQSIVKYDDNNKDTIKVTIKLVGIVHPPPLGSNPPSKPFERLETYKFCKVNGNWKVERIFK